jgi:hypothetical protein
MSLSMRKNIEQLSEDGKQATLKLVNIVTRIKEADKNNLGAANEATSSK